MAASPRGLERGQGNIDDKGRIPVPTLGFQAHQVQPPDQPPLHPGLQERCRGQLWEAEPGSAALTPLREALKSVVAELVIYTPSEPQTEGHPCPFLTWRVLHPAPPRLHPLPQPRAEHNYSILIASPWGTSPCGQVLAQQVQWVNPSLLTWTPPPSLPTVTIINSWLKNPSNTDERHLDLFGTIKNLLRIIILKSNNNRKVLKYIKITSGKRASAR